MIDPAADAHARVLAEHPEAIVVERGRYHIKHRLADGPDGRPRFVLDSWLPPIAGGAPDTVNETVAAGADDAYESRGGGGFDATQIYVRLDGSTNVGLRYDGGFRFASVAVPNGATIDVAYLSVVPYSGDYDDPYCTLYLEDEDDPVDFTAEAHVGTRALTTESAAWIDTGLYVNATTYVNSPSIVDAVKEVVDRPGWATGQAMMVIGIGGVEDGPFVLKSYENTDNVPAKLHIEYTAGDVTISATTATATAAALLPTILGSVLVSGTVATATATALLPSIITAVEVEVAGEEATATADALTPTVTAIKNVEIAGETATAVAAALNPTVEIAKTIAGAVATATAEALTPTVVTTSVVEVSAVTATATATAPTPTVVGVEITISAVTATASASALLPSILYDKTLTAVTATATATALLPAFTDIIYAQFGKIIAAIDPDDYPSGTTLKLLVVLWTSAEAEPVYARLYNVTDATVGSEATVNTDSESPVEVLSSALSLPSGTKTYRIEVGGVGGGTYYCAKAVVQGVV